MKESSCLLGLLRSKMLPTDNDTFSNQPLSVLLLIYPRLVCLSNSRKKPLDELLNQLNLMPHI